MGKRVQIRAKKTDLNSERICDAYVDDQNKIQLEFKRGKVFTTLPLDELKEQLETLSRE